MKRGEILTLTVLVAVVPVLLSASSDDDMTLRFIPETYDFGTILEDDGPARATVTAVNATSDTLFITSVRTSCGCTAAEFDKGILAPTDTAHISFTYNPANRPGSFEKTVKVFTGEPRVVNRFNIKGKVKASRTSLDKAYPHKGGNLQFSSLIVDAGKVGRGEMVPLFIGIYNPGENEAALAVKSSSEALEATLLPDTIPPSELGSLTMVLKGMKFNKDIKEIREYVYITDRIAGDTIVRIPVGGYIVP